MAILSCSHTKYNYDENGVRYKLASTNKDSDLNWIFIPGGPGADSRYLESLVELLHLPGNVWLIDLPGSGDNSAPENYDFHQWLHLMPKIASRYNKPVIIGHSLGGMLPLLSPELESKLSGLIIINSSPSLWVSESEKRIKDLGIPELPEKKEFIKNNTQKNYKNLLKAYIPYYFKKENVNEGYELFNDLPFPVETMFTVFGIMKEINFNAKWVPQRVPTLVIGGENDYINPFSLYENDNRFDRNNIYRVLIKDCGHWCWIEKPDDVKSTILDFADNHINP